MIGSIGWKNGSNLLGLLTLFMALGFLVASPFAHSAGKASTFITTSIPLPKGGLPAADSGYSDDRTGGNPVSANGRFVAFQSDAAFGQAKVLPDTINVFRKDRRTGKVILVSRGDGANGNGITTSTGDLSISGNGNLIAFTTTDQLDPADADTLPDVYIRNVAENTTTLATPGTAQSSFSSQLSANGQYLIFSTVSQVTGTDSNNSPDVFRRRLSDGDVELVSRIPASDTAGNKSSFVGDISDDGRWIVFSSTSTDLVAGFVDNNGQYSRDVFIRDMAGGETTLISCNYANASTSGNDESDEPVIAGSASAPAEIKIAYTSRATDVAEPGVDASTDASVYLRTPDSTASTLISVNSGGENADSRAHTPSISGNGGRIIFTSDATNLGGPDTYYGVYLRDRGSNKTTLVSAHNDYAVLGAISSDGKVAAWSERGSSAGSDPGVSNVFTRSLPYGTIAPASRPAGKIPFVLPGAAVSASSNSGAQISHNGRYVVVMASSSRLPGYRVNATQAYRRDLKTGQWTLVSRANGANGAPSKEGAHSASISADGTKVLFLTWVKLSPDDTDSNTDAYLRDLTKGTTTLVSRADGLDGADANGSVSAAAISGSGRRVVFSTYADNLGVPGGQVQIYVRDFIANRTILVSRADGNAGAAGNHDSDAPDISNDGNLVSFASYSTNLSPDDADSNRSVFIRNLSAETTTLVSRKPGLAGQSATGTQSSPDLSGNGKFVAWLTTDETVAPEAGAWPASQNQIVIRNIASGDNSLISRSAGAGDPAESGASDVSLSDDGSVAAFASYSTNLISGLGGSNRSAIFVRDLAHGGSLAGPPAFGALENATTTGAFSPSISGNGRCVLGVRLQRGQRHSQQPRLWLCLCPRWKL